MISKELKYFFSKVTDYKKSLALLIVGLLGSVTTVLMLGFFIKNIINLDAASSSYSLNQNFINLMLIVIALSFFIFSRSFNIAKIAGNIELDIKLAVMQKLISFDYEYFCNESSDVINNKTSEDISNIKESIIIFFSFFIRNTILIIGGVILLFFSSLEMTLLLLCMMPIILLPTALLIKKLKIVTKELGIEKDKYYGECSEVLDSINLVQTYSRQTYSFHRILLRILNYRKSLEKHIFSKSSIIATIILLIMVALLSVTWFGISGSEFNYISAGNLASFVYYAVVVGMGLAGMSEVAVDMAKGSVSAKNIFEILNEKNDEKSVEHPLSDIEKVKEINFKDVSYSFQGKEIITGVNFKVKEGEKIAIVGPSGAGKTTILNILVGLLKPTKGEALYKTNKSGWVNVNAVKDLLSYVPQEPKIFSGKLSDNIKFVKPDATKEEIVDALKKVNLLDEIENNFVDGINSNVGVKGKKLSLGQKHRVSLARAFIRKPEILLIDESMSNLDSNNERLITNAMNILMSKKTCFIITHKLSSIKKADKILVINEGRMLNYDTHENLMRDKGLYNHLFLQQ